MKPGIYNFTLYQGTHDGIQFALTDNAVPIDLTGCTAVMTVRRDYDKPAVLSASTADGKIIINPLLGKVSVKFTPTDTSGIRFTGDSLDLVYDIEITNLDGIVTRALMGSITLSREVTRV